jgi:hypothetical protein
MTKEAFDYAGVTRSTDFSTVPRGQTQYLSLTATVLTIFPSRAGYLDQSGNPCMPLPRLPNPLSSGTRGLTNQRSLTSNAAVRPIAFQRNQLWLSLAYLSAKYIDTHTFTSGCPCIRAPRTGTRAACSRVTWSATCAAAISWEATPTCSARTRSTSRIKRVYYVNKRERNEANAS